MGYKEKNKLISNSLWLFFDHCGKKGITFVISIILARLLSPEEFGVLSIMLVFTGLLGTFIDSGLASALIQKKDADERDFSTIYFFNIGVSAVVYALLSLIAPYIGSYYRNATIAIYLPFLATTLLISAFSRVHFAILSKKMLFKLNFRISWISTAFSGLLGCLMAYYGCGVWALIAQQIANALVNTLLLRWFIRWSPSPVFVWTRLRQLFKFGYKLLLSGMLDTITNDVYAMLIGRAYSLDDLALYKRGDSFPQMGISIANSGTCGLIFPAMSSMQGDKDKMKKLARRSIKVSMFISSLLLFGLFSLAEPVVDVLLGAKWLSCVFFLQIGCFKYLLWPVHIINLQTVCANGRSDYYLILEIVKKAQIFLALIFSYQYGIRVLMLVSCGLSFVSFFENAFPLKSLIGYSIKEQLKDFLPLIGIGLAAYGITYFAVSYVRFSLGQIAVGMLTFTAVYMLLSFVLHLAPLSATEVRQFLHRS